MIRLLIKLVLLAMLACALAGGGFLWWSRQPLEVLGGRADFTIARGSTARGAAQAIRQVGVDLNVDAFYWLVRLVGKARLIKAGSYEIHSGLSSLALLDKLTAGDVSQRELRLVEGWTFSQLRAAVDAHPDLSHDAARMSDAEILKHIGAPEEHPEGLFFPDTYLFDLHSSDLDLYRRAYSEMQTRLAAAWEARSPELPLATPYQALTLASIVEKETGRHEDRALIASVFVNRLRAGMRLQTDPSVIYGMGARFDGNLRRRDLEAENPYNTYLHVGLPPTPISMPSMASIEAAMKPADSRFLYFVARGDGSSQFSTGLDEHNRAVARYQLGKGNP